MGLVSRIASYIAALLLQLLCLSIVRSVWADGKNCFCKINLKPLGQNDSIHAPYDRGSVEIVGGGLEGVRSGKVHMRVPKERQNSLWSSEHESMGDQKRSTFAAKV